MMWLSLRMLMGDRAKYLGIVLGVTMSALLMSHQMTIFVGLMSRTRSIFQDLAHADLIVAHPETEFVEDVRALADTDVLRVRGVDGVAWAVPLLRTNIGVRVGAGKQRTCVVVGLDDATLIGGPVRMHAGRLEDLRETDGVIIDRLDAEKLLSTVGADGVKRTPGVGDVIEINDRKARIVAVSDNPRPFLSQPIVYTTLTRAREFAPPQRRQVSFVLAGMAAGANRAAVQARIAERTGLSAYTRLEFGWKTIRYFVTNTGIPVNFGVTVLLGCVVGIAICGQTFYLFVLENIKQLGALKAMGAGNGQLTRMVVAQAAVVGVIGYGMGVGLTAAFFVTFIGTDLDFRVHWEVLALTAGAITVITGLACAASLRRVLTLEPGIVFKG